MIRLRSSALGAPVRRHPMGVAAPPLPEPRVYRYRPPTTGIKAGPWDFTYSELVQRFVDKPVKVYAMDVNRNLWFYPSVEKAISHLGGFCRAVHDVFERDAKDGGGLWIPWRTGTKFIEPGLFGPGKTWEQMVRQSRALRDGRDEKWDACAGEFVPTIQQYKLWDRLPLTTNYVITGPRGQTFCEKGAGGTIKGSWSFGIPTGRRTSQMVAETAAAWVDAYSVGTPGKYRTAGVMSVFCQRRSPERTETAWGHQYNVEEAVVSLVGPKGVKQGPITRRVEKPILILQFGGEKLGRAPLTPTGVRNYMARGDWPPQHTVGAKWVDTGEEFNPASLIPPPKPPPKGGTAALVTLAAAGAGVALLALGGGEGGGA